jgi:hypothetical protein
MRMVKSSPERGGGPRAERVVEAPRGLRLPDPSTMVRMVPLLVPGRTWA